MKASNDYLETPRTKTQAADIERFRGVLERGTFYYWKKKPAEMILEIIMPELGGYS